MKIFNLSRLRLIVSRLIKRLRRTPMIPVSKLKQYLDTEGDLMLLDVRGQAEYYGAQGHIVGTYNIPVEDLLPRMKELMAFQERRIAVVCRTDRRSAKAAELLKRKGFARVQVVRGGMTAWRSAGLPVTCVQDIPSLRGSHEDPDEFERSPLWYGAGLQRSAPGEVIVEK